MSAPETATGGERSRRSRSLELDVLRGVAILLVLLHHPQLDARWFSGALRPVAVALWRFAWSGVDLFFVLSGFLVGGLLLDELSRTGTLDARRFLIRRAFKIWPSYLVLVAWIFVSESQGGWKHALRATLPSLLHVQNYFGSPRIPTWSLGGGRARGQGRRAAVSRVAQALVPLPSRGAVMFTRPSGTATRAG